MTEQQIFKIIYDELKRFDGQSLNVNTLSALNEAVIDKIYDLKLGHDLGFYDLKSINADYELGKLEIMFEPSQPKSEMNISNPRGGLID